MQASGLLELIPFICTSAVLGLILFPCSLLAFPQLLSNHRGGGVASGGLKFWKPSFTLGGQTLLMAMTFLVY